MTDENEYNDPRPVPEVHDAVEYGTTDADGRPLPATNWYPERYLPIHDGRHCPAGKATDSWSQRDPAWLRAFTAGAWDGWLGFAPVGPLSDIYTPQLLGAYSDGRNWGIRFRHDGSPW